MGSGGMSHPVGQPQGFLLLFLDPTWESERQRKGERTPRFGGEDTRVCGRGFKVSPALARVWWDPFESRDSQTHHKQPPPKRLQEGSDAPVQAENSSLLLALTPDPCD